MDKWEGKVAIVTGASAGIGYATARLLAEHGLIVVAMARRFNRLKELADSFKGKGKIIPMEGDVSSSSSVEQVFKKVEKEVGQPRVLINNAGTLGNDTSVTNLNVDEWKKLFDVNLFGLLYCTKYFVESVRANKPGLCQIVNINSILGYYLISDEYLIYSASKHSVTMLTRAFIRDFARNKDDIKISNVSPGLVDTEIFSEEVAAVIFKNPYLKSEDVADAVVIALSSKDSVLLSEITIKPTTETT